MFSKPANKTVAPVVKPASAPEPIATQLVAEAPRAKPRVASLISSGISIDGGVTGDGELQIDGIVRGDVRVGRRTVGETGQIEGSVYAEAAEIRGRVVGSVSAKQVRLHGSAHVDGDITHEQLAMETGAFFQGRSIKFQRPAAVPQPAPAQPVSDTLTQLPDETIVQNY
jgi:cytoskeletal protein CcmA (bactofilin family)